MFDGDPGFITCPPCRNPLPDTWEVNSGCHYWPGVPNPKINTDHAESRHL